jgi:hypothetical protein
MRRFILNNYFNALFCPGDLQMVTTHLHNGRLGRPVAKKTCGVLNSCGTSPAL